MSPLAFRMQQAAAGVGGGETGITLVSSGLLFADQFDRADGAIGNGWLGDTGNFRLVSGELVADGYTGTKTIYQPTSLQDVMLAWMMRENSDSFIESKAILRYDPATGNCYQMNVWGDGKLYIHKIVGGSPTQLGSGQVSVGGSNCRLSFAAIGTNPTVLAVGQGGILKKEVSDSEATLQTAGYFGFRQTFGDSGRQVVRDNLLVMSDREVDCSGLPVGKEARIVGADGAMTLDVGAAGAAAVDVIGLGLPAVSVEIGDTSVDLTNGKGTIESGHYGGQVPTYAFDDNSSTYWEGSGSGSWVGIDYGSAVAVQRLTLQPRAFSGAAQLKDFKLQGSDDQSTWHDVYVGQHANSESAEVYVFNNANAYRYWRVYVTSSWRGDFDGGGIRECQMFERQIDDTYSGDIYGGDSYTYSP